MATGRKIPANWNIKNLDTGEVLNPPYPIDGGVKVTAGSNLAKQGRRGMEDPLVQWTGGKGQEWSFQAVLWSEDRTDIVSTKLRKFIALTQKDSKLDRPPICSFSVGAVFSEVVLVESVDPEISDLRPDGEAREVRLNFHLVKYVPFTQKRIDPSRPVKESFYLVATSEEASYEAIARRFYGNPLLGDLLRRRHPHMPGAPTVGKIVKVPSRTIILREEVAPQFHALSLTNPAAVATFEAKLAARSNKSLVIL